MVEVKPNSHKYKEEQRALEPEKRKSVKQVASGTKKKSKLKKLTDIFVPEDVDDVKSYVLWDIVFPSIKATLFDILKMFLGDEHYSSSRNSSRTSYRSYYDKVNKHEVRDTRTRLGYGYDNVVVDTRGEAELVLDQMKEMAEMYDMVSVADLYEMVGITGDSTDYRYGWTSADIRRISVVRVRDGYLLKLPRALPLNLS